MEFTGKTTTQRIKDYNQLRTKGTVSQLEQKLFDIVWYNRNFLSKVKLESEKEKFSPNDFDRKIKIFEKIEEEHGIENLYFENDFEWGNINGMFSAVRWIMGEEWDMLDT